MRNFRDDRGQLAYIFPHLLVLTEFMACASEGITVSVKGKKQMSDYC